MTMQTLSENARAALCAASGGAGNYLDSASDLTAYTQDWRGRYHGVAALVLRPKTVADVQAIVRAAATHRVALVPQGGNTGLVGGGVPDESGTMVVLSLQRLTQIRAILPEDYSVSLDAGVILSELQTAADTVDRLFPLSLGAQGSARIGGLISTNAGGVQVLRYGTMRALVLGLEAVLPDGSLFSDMSPLRKNNTGYDIKQLLIGAEGTLGVITGATLKLFPKPQHTATAMVGLSDPARAVALLSRMRACTGDSVSSFELIPHTALELVLKFLPGTRSPLENQHLCYALIEATSTVEVDTLTPAFEAGLLAAMAAGELQDVAVAQSSTHAAAFWKLRESIPEAEKAEGPAVKHDVSVPVMDMPHFIEVATQAVEQAVAGVRVLAFGHLGDGNVHFNVRPPIGAVPADFVRDHGSAVSQLVHDVVMRFGGSISAEHGIGALKRDELARVGDPAKLAAMRAIKAALDPLGIMNPTRVL
jgi:FAD/FMN-containing dehydrogenase